MEQPKNGIFRQAALEKLSSPEQLDGLMRVTAPADWLALAVAGALLFLVVLWGLFGSIPNKISGQGLLIRGGAVLDVEAGTSGRITTIDVKPGDLVRPGQTVAIIAQSGLDLKIQNTRALLEELKAQAAKYSSADQKNAESALAALQQERASRESAIKDNNAQVAALGNKVASEEELARKGLVTQNSVMNARNSLYAAQQTLNQNRIRLTQITTEEGTLRRSLDQQSGSRQREIDATTRQLRELEGQLDASTAVISPYAGRVLERVVDRGNLVNQGSRVVTLETLDTPLKTVIFVPARDGKKVQPGMAVDVSPSTVRREEFGFMIGRVESVSSFPATPEGMRRVLRNNSLIEELVKAGAPLEVVAELVPDPSTVSQFKWSSPKGPPTGVFGGTLCTASITVSQRRPIAYVIPLVKDTLGLQ